MEITYESFEKFVTSADFLNNVKDILGGAGQYAYEGFKPRDMFEALVKITKANNQSISDFASNMTLLLGIFHVRGPNVSNMKAENTKGGKKQIEELSALRTLYYLKAKAAGSHSNITLPRLSLVFPYLSYMIFSHLEQEKKMNVTVTESEIGLEGIIWCSPNYIPSLLDPSDLENGAGGTSFFLHCMYQGILSYKTEVVPKSKNASKKTKQEHFVLSTRFAKLASDGSMALAAEESSFKDSIVPKIKALDHTAFWSCVNRYFDSPMPTTRCEEVTKYHYLINYCILKNTTTSSISADDANMTFPDIKRKFSMY